MPSLIRKSIGGLTSIALEPAVPASCLAFILLAPSDLVERVFNPEVLQRLFGVTDAKLPLCVLLAVGALRKLSRLASRAALNNWSLKPQPGWEWRNETAVVTGGCSGIGKAIVLGLVERGVKVAVLDVLDPPDDLSALGSVQHWKCDITSSEDVKVAAEGIRLALGHPSILVNNAGVADSQSILGTTDDYLHRVIHVNQRSLWVTTREFLPDMVLNNKGHIVNMASMASYFAIPMSVAYSATKAAALTFTEGLRNEINYLYDAPGVMVTSVHPMWVHTDMTDRFADNIRRSQGGRPLMTPEHVARPVLRQIFSCRGGHVHVPGVSSWFSVIRALPGWLQGVFWTATAKRAYKSVKERANYVR